MITDKSRGLMQQDLKMYERERQILVNTPEAHMFRKRVEELNDIIGKLKEKLNKTDEQYLAEFLHSKFCRYNHTDGCGFFYEGNDWNKPEHNRWLETAQDVLKIEPDVDKIIKIITLCS